MRLLIIAVLLCLLIPVHVYAEMVSVKGEEVNLRNGPGTNYGVEWKYGKGLPLQVIERQNDWVKVVDFEGESGWIFHTLLSKKKTVIINTGKDKQLVAIVRKEPKSGATAVAKAHHGVIFTLLHQQGDWLKVASDSGVKGWIEKKFAWGY